MANGARSLGLCAPISVIQSRCQVVLAKKEKKRENENDTDKKNQSAICSHLHSLLPDNKASINANGTLLEQNYMSHGCNRCNIVEKKQTNRISVRLRYRHGMVDFIDPQKQTSQSLPVWGGMWDVFFLLELLFSAQPNSYNVILMAYCKTTAAPVCYQWSYGSPAPSH